MPLLTTGAGRAIPGSGPGGGGFGLVIDGTAADFLLLESGDLLLLE